MHRTKRAQGWCTYSICLPGSFNFIFPKWDSKVKKEKKSPTRTGGVGLTAGGWEAQQTLHTGKETRWSNGINVSKVQVT